MTHSGSPTVKMTSTTPKGMFNKIQFIVSGAVAQCWAAPFTSSPYRAGRGCEEAHVYLTVS
jgi:hypothetical protein